MPAKPRAAKFETPSARLRIAIRAKPYTATKLRRGLLLLYRRCRGPGTWAVRMCRGDDDWVKQIGVSDDRDPANGKDIFDYWQAIDEAKRIADGGKSVADNTVKCGLDAYKANLEERGREQWNVTRVLRHLPTRLAGKVVTTLTDDDLKPFKDVLLAKMKPNSARRTIKAFRAAMNWIADRDRIPAARRLWNGPMLRIADSGDPASNVILNDHDRLTAKGAAHRDSDAFGLLFDVLDETGARPSQVVRLKGEDVQADFADPTGKRQPRIMMPVSRKGHRTKDQATHRPVPITESLAKRLKGRSGVLLKRIDGKPWAKVNLPNYFAAAIKNVRFNNPAKVTLYALRHTSIVRMLLAGVPTAVVARLHDTSTDMIEKHYSRYIADVSDTLARPTLPAPSQVLSLDDRRPGA